VGCEPHHRNRAEEKDEKPCHLCVRLTTVIGFHESEPPEHISMSVVDSRRKCVVASVMHTELDWATRLDICVGSPSPSLDSTVVSFSAQTIRLWRIESIISCGRCRGLTLPSGL
jgi:hypothetical protein